jgi:uncharacterized protein YeaO (DUF488 family)
MAIRIVRLGSPRHPDEGVRLGTVRHPPRGVPKIDFARRDFFDVWLPELAPGAALVAAGRTAHDSAAAWRQFVRRYRREMSTPAARHLIETLAALSQKSNFSIGCYCDDEARCHRSVLKKLLQEAGAQIAA